MFGSLEDLAESSTGFANDAESLFEAVRFTAVDFDGRTRICSPACDLSKYVVAEGDVFDTRDGLFTQFGTLEGTLRGKAFELFYSGRKSP